MQLSSALGYRASHPLHFQDIFLIIHRLVSSRIHDLRHDWGLSSHKFDGPSVGTFRCCLGLRRSNNPLALSSTLGTRVLIPAMRHHRASSPFDANAALSHLAVDPLPPGGSWHGMRRHKTLSPGPWMEFPGFPLARFLADHAALQPEAAVTAALQLQPRSTIAEYYRAAAEHFGVTKSYRPWRVESVVRTPAASSLSGGSSQPPTWTVTFADSVSPPLRARALVLDGDV